MAPWGTGVLRSPNKGLRTCTSSSGGSGGTRHTEKHFMKSWALPFSTISQQRHSSPHASSRACKRGKSCLGSSKATPAFTPSNVQWNICCAHSSRALAIAQGMGIKWLLVHREGQWKSKESCLECTSSHPRQQRIPEKDKPPPSTYSNHCGGLWSMTIKGNSTRAHKNYFLMRKKNIHARFSVPQLLTQRVSGSVREISAEAANAFSAYLFQLIPPKFKPKGTAFQR